MNKYETMMVTSAKLDEEATTALVDRFKRLIEKNNGTIEAVDAWGKRRLAYPINKEEEGVYTLIYFEAEPDFNRELERRYRITDGVLRSMIVARPEGAELPKVAETPAPKEAAPAVEAKADETVAEEVAEVAAPEEAVEEAVAEKAVAEAPAEEAVAEEAAPAEEAPAAEAAEEPAAEEAPKTEEAGE